MNKPTIKLTSKEDINTFWKEMPKNCFVAQKQFKGDWVGSYENDVWIVCKDKDDKIIKIIEEEKLPFRVDWVDCKKIIKRMN